MILIFIVATFFLFTLMLVFAIVLGTGLRVGREIGHPRRYRGGHIRW